MKAARLFLIDIFAKALRLSIKVGEISYGEQRTVPEILPT